MIRGEAWCPESAWSGRETHWSMACLHVCSLVQVCSYRCIASHESAQFEAFSLCILQKHNCLGLHVKIPTRPSPEPMQAFRNETMTHEIAEQLFIGWLGGTFSHSYIAAISTESTRQRLYKGMPKPEDLILHFSLRLTSPPTHRMKCDHLYLELRCLRRQEYGQKYRIDIRSSAKHCFLQILQSLVLGP